MQHPPQAPRALLPNMDITTVTSHAGQGAPVSVGRARGEFSYWASRSG